jgi:hypothetical protein
MPLRIDIPLSEGTPLPFFDMQAPLEGVTYTLQFRWNVRNSSWYMNVLDEQSETVFIAGIRLVSNWPLAAYNTGRSPPGSFVVVDTGGEGADADISSLGIRHLLLYFTAAELGLG